jgi:phosphatidylglycerophosphatase A
MTDQLSPRLLLNPAGFLALGFGSGFVPVGPGTAGTLVAVPLYLLLQPLHPGFYIGLVGLLFLAGIPICSHVARRLDVHDHPGIVWDEIVGFLVAMAFAPAGWAWLVTGFILFRFFDIAKPWPIRWCDRQVSGGLGIMLDDLLAGVFAAVVLQLLVYFL